MRKLRVGVWLPDNYIPEVGGGYTYLKTLINGLVDYEFQNAELVFLSAKSVNISEQIQTPVFVVDNYPIHISNPSKIDKIKNSLKKLFFLKVNKYDYHELLNAAKRKLLIEVTEKVDLIYYVTPSQVLPEIPFICTLWDIGNRSTFPFPEWSTNDINEARNRHIDDEVSKAIKILVESEAGLSQAKKLLNIHLERFEIVPIFPNDLNNEELKTVVPKGIESESEFIHYPAQFWPHKNHYNLLLAFTKVIRKHPNLNLYFTGSDKGNLIYIKKLIQELNITQNVKYLGFVSDSEIKWLYKNSKGLVMPTYLGPTNMPLLEAAALGCPVACSNLEGHMEMLVEGACFFDPASPAEIENAILKMLEEKKKPSINNKFTLKSALQSLDDTFAKIQPIRFTWDKYLS
jgi:glycosyltransferase involved in cell wall biosynthesis